MSNKTKLKKHEKKVFHTPERVRDAKEIPATPANKVLSIVGLLLAIALTGFAVFAIVSPYRGSNAGQIELYGSYRLIFVFFTIVDWIVLAGFRVGCKTIPLDMWRMSVKVKKGVVKSEGRLLKTLTLALELETTICFGYITGSLYMGYNPSDAIVLTWVAALVLSVYLFVKQARLAADGIIRYE